MGDFSKQNAALKAEMASVIIFLGLGPAEIEAKSETELQLGRKGTSELTVSSKAIAYLARKKWVKREGKKLFVTSTAPRIGDQNPVETVSVELVENGSTRTVTRVAVESPIDYLASRKDKNGKALLNHAEWSAGDRLRSDFTRANMLPGIGMRWGEAIRVSGGAGGGATQTEAVIAASARVRKALDAVGPEFSGLLIDVCCFLKGLEQVEAERKWPQRSAKIMLRAALSILARHYAPPATPSAKIRNWGSDDYRPSI